LVDIILERKGKYCKEKIARNLLLEKRSMEKNTTAKFLFIGGAPRSGTTLLMNLLDSHPDLLVFPFEHSTIERYFWNKDNIQHYALNEFISKRQEGQQTILANKDFLNQYYQKIKKEYNKDFSLDINPEVFFKTYADILKNRKIELKDILSALTYALATANTFAESKYSQSKYFVFKQPYYTDLFAEEVSELLPDAKFIYISRDPFARYSSAKKRRVTISKLNKKIFIHINGTNFVEAHSEVDISAHYIAKKNENRLGNKKYKTLNYEKILEDPDPIFYDLFSWLSVDQSNCYFKPTFLGKPALGGSLFINGEGIDKNAANRRFEYQSITNWNERVLHRYYLTKGGLINEKKPGYLYVLVSYFLPLKHEGFLHFLYRLIFIWHLFGRRDFKNRLPGGVKKRKYFISGAT